MEKKRILVVDDEPAFTRVLKLTLEEAGAYDVLVVNEGAKVLAAAKAFQPDLVLLDIVMPDLEGSYIASKMGEDPQLAKIPIVFLTAIVSRNEVVTRGAVIGGHPFLAKPVSVAEVMESIERYLQPQLARVSRRRGE